jgi:hypothetical protein
MMPIPAAAIANFIWGRTNARKRVKGEDFVEALAREKNSVADFVSIFTHRP